LGFVIKMSIFVQNKRFSLLRWSPITKASWQRLEKKQSLDLTGQTQNWRPSIPYFKMTFMQPL